MTLDKWHNQYKLPLPEMALLPSLHFGEHPGNHGNKCKTSSGLGAWWRNPSELKACLSNTHPREAVILASISPSKILWQVAVNSEHSLELT